MSRIYQDVSPVNRNIATGLADHKTMSVLAVILLTRQLMFLLLLCRSYLLKSNNFLLDCLAVCHPGNLPGRVRDEQMYLWNGVSFTIWYALSLVTNFTNILYILLKSRKLSSLDFYHLKLIWKRKGLSLPITALIQTRPSQLSIWNEHCLLKRNPGYLRWGHLEALAGRTDSLTEFLSRRLKIMTNLGQFE